MTRVLGVPLGVEFAGNTHFSLHLFHSFHGDTSRLYVMRKSSNLQTNVGVNQGSRGRTFRTYIVLLDYICVDD